MPINPPPNKIPIPVDAQPFNPASVVHTWNYSSSTGTGEFSAPNLFGGANEGLSSLTITLWYVSIGPQVFPIYSFEAASRSGAAQSGLMNANSFAGFTVLGMEDASVSPADVVFSWHYTSAAGNGEFAVPALLGGASQGLTDLALALWYAPIGTVNFPIYSFAATSKGGAIQYGIMNANNFAGITVYNMQLNLGTGPSS